MDLEQASAQIDVLIDRRARERSKANELEDLWRESVSKHHERTRRENRAQWYAHFCGMAESHVRLAEDYERRAKELCEEGGGGQAVGGTMQRN